MKSFFDQFFRGAKAKVALGHIVAGGAGGFAASLIQFGCVLLPSCSDGKLYLGTLGGIALGCIAGWYGNTNPTNAFMWGLGGTGLLKSLMQVGAPKLQQCASVFADWISRSLT